MLAALCATVSVRCLGSPAGAQVWPTRTHVMIMHYWWPACSRPATDAASPAGASAYSASPAAPQAFVPVVLWAPRPRRRHGRAPPPPPVCAPGGRGAGRAHRLRQGHGPAQGAGAAHRHARVRGVRSELCACGQPFVPYSTAAVRPSCVPAVLRCWVGRRAGRTGGGGKAWGARGRHSRAMGEVWAGIWRCVFSPGLLRFSSAAALRPLPPPRAKRAHPSTVR